MKSLILNINTKKIISFLESDGFAAIFVSALLIGVVSFAIYLLEKDAVYYCDYCHKGSHRNKTEVIYEYGKEPCTVAKDSIHHFRWHSCAPKYKKLPKYVKE